MKAKMGLVAWVVVASLGCGTSEPEPMAKPTKERPEPSQKSDSIEKAVVKPAAKDKTDDVKRFKGSAQVETVKEGEPPEKGALALELTDTGEVKGSLLMGGIKIGLKGLKQDDVWRLWAAFETDDLTAIRRGYLLGLTEGEQVEGRFAISGNGGEPRLLGSWRVR